MHGTERTGNLCGRSTYFTGILCVTICVHSTYFTRENRSFCKNVNFGLVALAFHYGSCFNASLSRYTL